MPKKINELYLGEILTIPLSLQVTSLEMVGAGNTIVTLTNDPYDITIKLYDKEFEELMCKEGE